jgi:hypothetical protein
LASCATGPRYSEVETKIPAQSAGQGRIYFYRATNVIGSAIQPEVLLNGEKVGRSIPSGYFFVDRPPGDFEVKLTTEVERKLSFKLQFGEQRYVRMHVELGALVYRVFPELIDSAEALEAIKKLHYTGSMPLK